jgi:5'-nucleotidase
MPTILVSNDDGIESKGLHALAEALSSVGKVVIVAPDREQSTTSHSLTLHRPLRVKQIREDVHTVNGTPTDCVYWAARWLFHQKGYQPDLVCSGINRGANLGHDVTYSGTVACAFEGTLLGIPSIAFSMVGGSPYHFETAAQFAPKVAAQVLEHGMPPDVLINVNVPNLPPEKIQGVEVTRLGKHRYGEEVVERVDPRGSKYYWIGGEDRGLFEDLAGTDGAAVQHERISVTPLHLDLTNDDALAPLRQWKLD